MSEQEPMPSAERAVAIPLLRLGDRSVGRRLRFYRRQRGLSQTRLAELANISQPTVSRIENNPKCATVGQLHTLCDKLQITVFDLLEDEAVHLTVGEAGQLRLNDRDVAQTAPSLVTSS